MHTPTRRQAVKSALAFGVVGATTGFLSGCNNLPSSIKIGVAQPMSGGLAALGQDMRNGVKLAVAELNKEGFKIKGQPVTLEVMAVDDPSVAHEHRTFDGVLELPHIARPLIGGDCLNGSWR